VFECSSVQVSSVYLGFFLLYLNPTPTHQHLNTFPIDFYILLIAFFFIALIYSSVGFGGGSSYLALMAVLGISREVMSPTALLCNIIVVTGGTIIYYKEKRIDFQKCWPFLVASVPCAFLGAYLKIRDDVFFLLLGISLIVAAVLLWVQQGVDEKSKSAEGNVLTALGLGGGIGFLSGLVSIGGGIFLSPILYLMKWDNAAKIAALASLFILVNSISALAGNLIGLGGTPIISTHLDWKFILPLLLSVLVGGQIGSRLGTRKFNLLYIKRITATLIFLAGLNILKDHL
jgi:uncharacterized membrane protein YfcA